MANLERADVRDRIPTDEYDPAADPLGASRTGRNLQTPEQSRTHARFVARTHAPATIPEQTRNVTLTRVAGWIRRAGHDVATITDALTTINAERCAPPLDDPAEIRRIARSIGSKPPGTSGGQSRAEHTAQSAAVARIIALVDTVPLTAARPARHACPGARCPICRTHRTHQRTELTDRAVLDALLRIAHDTGRVQVDAAHRDLAPDAATGRTTITNAVRRLNARGWLYVIRRGRVHIGPAAARPTTATLYRLSIPKRLRRNVGATVDIREASVAVACMSTVAPPDADPWRRGSRIGQTGKRLWLALDADRPQTVAQLAQTIRKSRWTLRRILAAMAAAGMATPAPTGWIRGPVAPADAEVRTRGVGATQRAQFAAERAPDRIEQLQETVRRRLRLRRLAAAATAGCDPITGEVDSADDAPEVCPGSIAATAAPSPPTCRPFCGKCLTTNVGPVPVYRGGVRLCGPCAMPKSTAAIALRATITDRDGSTYAPPTARRTPPAPDAPDAEQMAWARWKQTELNARRQTGIHA